MNARPYWAQRAELEKPAVREVREAFETLCSLATVLAVVVDIALGPPKSTKPRRATRGRKNVGGDGI